MHRGNLILLKDFVLTKNLDGQALNAITTKWKL